MKLISTTITSLEFINIFNILIAHWLRSITLHEETLTRVPVTREANFSRVKEAVKMSSKVRRGSTNGDQRGVKRNAACCDGTARCHIDRIREKGRQREDPVLPRVDLGTRGTGWPLCIGSSFVICKALVSLKILSKKTFRYVILRNFRK